jgi:hypothetical protein
MVLRLTNTNVRNRRCRLEHESERPRDIERDLELTVFWTLEYVHPPPHYVLRMKTQKLLSLTPALAPFMQAKQEATS